jgi:TM2 domain-containing membrane protein YozV
VNPSFAGPGAAGLYCAQLREVPLQRYEQPSDKSYTIAVCLSAIFGVVGIQHFYLGRLVEATIDLGLFIATIYFFVTGQILFAFVTGAIDAIHTFIVTIMLLTGTFRDGRGRLVMYPGQKLKTGDTYE